MNRVPPVVLGALLAGAGLAAASCTGAPGHNLFGSGGSGGGGAGGASSQSSSSGGGASSSHATGASTSSGAPVPVACDDGPCAVGQVCCLDRYSDTPPDFCGTSGQCGMGFVELSCSGPEDCPGALCCATTDPNDHQDPYLGTACAATCSDPDGSKVVLCSDADPSVCPSGTTCQSSSILPTSYRICN